MTSIVPTVVLASAAGARSMTGVAALAVMLADKPAGSADHAEVRVLRQPLVRQLALAAAAMELVGDKLPFIPNRTDPGPLLGRTMIGAVIGAVFGDIRNERVQGALIGAAAAFVATHATFHARRALSEILPPTAAALVEDVVTVAVASAVVGEWERQQISR